MIKLHGRRQCLTERHFGLAGDGLDLVFTLDALKQMQMRTQKEQTMTTYLLVNLKMQLTHAGNDGFFAFRINVHAEGRILQHKSVTQLMCASRHARKMMQRNNDTCIQSQLEQMMQSCTRVVTEWTCFVKRLMALPNFSRSLATFGLIDSDMTGSGMNMDVSVSLAPSVNVSPLLQSTPKRAQISPERT